MQEVCDTHRMFKNMFNAVEGLRNSVGVCDLVHLRSCLRSCAILLVTVWGLRSCLIPGMKYHPHRSVLFVTFAVEEGLLFVCNPQIEILI